MGRIVARFDKGTKTKNSGELRFGGVEVDFRRYEARRAGLPVEMTRKEFATLCFLAQRASQVVTRDDLLNEVCGYGSYPSSRTVDNMWPASAPSWSATRRNRSTSGLCMGSATSSSRENSMTEIPQNPPPQQYSAWNGKKKVAEPGWGRAMRACPRSRRSICT